MTYFDQLNQTVNRIPPIVHNASEAMVEGVEGVVSRILVTLNHIVYHPDIYSIFQKTIITTLRNGGDPTRAFSTETISYILQNLYVSASSRLANNFFRTNVEWVNNIINSTFFRATLREAGPELRNSVAGMIARRIT